MGFNFFKRDEYPRNYIVSLQFLIFSQPVTILLGSHIICIYKYCMHTHERIHNISPHFLHILHLTSAVSIHYSEHLIFAYKKSSNSFSLKNIPWWVWIIVYLTSTFWWMLRLFPLICYYKHFVMTNPEHTHLYCTSIYYTNRFRVMPWEQLSYLKFITPWGILESVYHSRYYFIYC